MRVLVFATLLRLLSNGFNELNLQRRERKNRSAQKNTAAQLLLFRQFVELAQKMQL